MLVEEEEHWKNVVVSDRCSKVRDALLLLRKEEGVREEEGKGMRKKGYQQEERELFFCVGERGNDKG